MGNKLTALCLFAALAIFGAYAHAQTSPIIGNAIPVVQSASAEASHVLKAAPGNLYSLSVTTSTAGYAMVFNALAASSTGTVTPTLCEEVPANSTANFQLPYPVPFSTGIVAQLSTVSCYSYTANSTGFFQAQVK